MVHSSFSFLLNNHNPLPLIYVVFSYNAYMYTHDWRNVLVWSYIWKTFHVIYTVIIHETKLGNIFNIFNNITNSIIHHTGKVTDENGDHLTTIIGHPENPETIYEVLIGTLIFTSLGIIMGYIHVYLTASPPDIDTFMTLSFWMPINHHHRQEYNKKKKKDESSLTTIIKNGVDEIDIIDL